MHTRRRFAAIAVTTAALLASAALPAIAADQFPSRPTLTAKQVGIKRLTGSHTYLETAPISVRLGELESDTETFIFAERQDLVLDDDLVAEITQPGIWFRDGTPRSERTPNALPRGAIKAGTRVDSFYGHFDNESYVLDPYKYAACWGQIGVIGTITFDRPILGVIFGAGNLNASNDNVGVDHTYYDEAEFTRFPGMNITDGCYSDQITMSEDRRSLMVRNFTDIHHDNFRVIVAADNTVDVDSSLRGPDPIPDTLGSRGIDPDRPSPPGAQ